MIDLDDYPVQAPNVVGRVLENEAVLVLPARGQVKVLNEVGARIWKLADGTRSVRAIAAQICAEYQVEAGQAERDTVQFVADLVSCGVITLAPQPTSRRVER